MKLLFWLSLGLTVYTYVGYAIWLWICTQLRSCRTSTDTAIPNISILIAARNEESNLTAKLTNLRLLKYPQERIQLIVVSDGSTDGTVGILRQHDSFLVPVILERSMGKAFALNEAVKRASGEILVFLDVRQRVDPDAVAALVSCFGDAEVGAVSGELLLEDASGAPASDALGIYWKIEKTVRKWESLSGSVVGATGAIYAIRRELYAPIPAGTLLDDVLIPMQVARFGKRVMFQPRAIARDRVFGERGKEFSRKVRTLTGNYQLLQLAPWLLSPANPLLFRFISHKLLRLMVPLFLVVLLVASSAVPSPLYRVFFSLQVVFYLGALLAALIPSAKRFKPFAIAHTFVMLNTAAAVAFYNFAVKRKTAWG